MDTPDPECTARKRGRPPRGTEDLRRREMLKAAETIFMEQGFGNASMEAVAKLAGISKKTIYTFVETKEELFEEVMKDHIASTDRPNLHDDIRDLADLESTLADYLFRLPRFILGPFAVRVFRLAVAEAMRFPNIAQSFYRQGALRSVHQLEDWLRIQIKSGWIALDDPMEGAVMLTSLVVLDPLRAAALGVAALPSEDAMKARAEHAAKIFLHGCLSPVPAPR